MFKEGRGLIYGDTLLDGLVCLDNGLQDPLPADQTPLGVRSRRVAPVGVHRRVEETLAFHMFL